MMSDSNATVSRRRVLTGSGLAAGAAVVWLIAGDSRQRQVATVSLGADTPTYGIFPDPGNALVLSLAGIVPVVTSHEEGSTVSLRPSRTAYLQTAGRSMRAPVEHRGPWYAQRARRLSSALTVRIPASSGAMAAEIRRIQWRLGGRVYRATGHTVFSSDVTVQLHPDRGIDDEVRSTGTWTYA